MATWQQRDVWPRSEIAVDDTSVHETHHNLCLSRRQGDEAVAYLTRAQERKLTTLFLKLLRKKFKQKLQTMVLNDACELKHLLKTTNQR